MLKLQWLASIWWQNDQNNAKLRKLSNYDELHRFDDKTIKNVSLRRKTLRTTQNYKSIQITMNLHRFEVETIKILTYVANSSNQSKATKLIKVQWIASIWWQNDQNNAILRELSTMNSINLMTKHSKQRKTTKAIKL